MIQIRPARLPEPAPAPNAVEVAERLLSDDAATALTKDTINFHDEVRKLLEDARMLREFSMRENRRTGRKEIANGVIFDKAIGRVASILTQAVRLSREVIDKQAMENFIAAMYWAVAQESPAAQRRIIDRLTMLGSPVLDIIQHSQPPPIDV